jgi:organic radical activating enzyme
MVITGGEPTLWNLDGLLKIAQQRGMTTQLETSGQNGFKGELRPQHITWSPKPNLRWGAHPDIWRHAAEVKWVVDEQLDARTVEKCFESYLGDTRPFEPGQAQMPTFVLMPEGCPPKEEYIKRALLWLRMIPRSWQPFFRFGDRLQYRLRVR